MSEQVSVERFNTVGEIVRRTGGDVHRIEYIIKARQIRPRGMAGNARVFSEADVDLIAGELRRLDAARAEINGRNGGEKDP